MTTLLAFDPGKTTGIALLTDRDLLVVHELPWLHAVDYLQQQLEYDHIDTIIYERFNITQHTIRVARQDEPMDFIGAMKWVAYKYGDVPCVPHLASSKDIITNDRLKEIGWYTRGKQHGRDATRHLVLYLAAHNPSRIPGAAR